MVLAVAAGCSTANLNTEYNKEVDFSSYKTFALLPFPSHVPGSAPGSAMGLGPLLQKTLRDTLVSKGFTEVPMSEADFTAGIRGEVNPQLRVHDYGYNYPVAPYWAGSYPYMRTTPMTSVSQYEEGVLIVEIFDAKTKELSWVGWSTRKRPEGASINAERVQAGIIQILSDFPPPSSRAKPLVNPSHNDS